MGISCGSKFTHLAITPCHYTLRTNSFSRRSDNCAILMNFPIRDSSRSATMLELDSRYEIECSPTAAREIEGAILPQHDDRLHIIHKYQKGWIKWIFFGSSD